MTEQNRRIGFGEPLTFEGDDADRIRNLLETGGVYPRVINDRSIYERLLRIAVPPVEACRPFQKVILDAVASVNSVDTVPEIGDPTRDAFERRMGEVFDSAQKAFNGRPMGCEMEDRGDGWFDCSRCNIEVAFEL